MLYFSKNMNMRLQGDYYTVTQMDMTTDWLTDRWSMFYFTRNVNMRLQVDYDTVTLMDMTSDWYIKHAVFHGQCEYEITNLITTLIQ